MNALNGYRVVLLTAIVALTILALAAVLFADEHIGVFIGIVSPTIVALVTLLRNEQQHHEMLEGDDDMPDDSSSG